LRRGQRRLGLANISGQATPISNRDPLSVIPISEPEINSTLCMAQPSQKRHTHGAADEHRRNPETAGRVALRTCLRARGAIVC